MKKRLLCVLVAAVLLIGVLAGCGDSPSDSPNSDKPGVGSTEPEKLDKGGQTNDDPVAVMEARVKAVNDAVNYTCIGLEETVESGLLFYKFDYYLAGPDDDKNRDYNPDKPLDYNVQYRMIKKHTEGIVSEDTYVALLKKEAHPEVVSSDVMETEELYVYYSVNMFNPGENKSECFILAKGTDVLYHFVEVTETWYKADYDEDGLYEKYTGDDVEYLCTPEFWEAFAQTAKFVGNADDDFKNSECLNVTVQTMGCRGKVKIPYIEEWYAGGHYSRDAIRRGFEAFLENRDEKVSFYLSDGTTKTYPATRDGDMVTVDFGDGQTWIYEDDGHGALRFSWDIIKENPEYGALEELPPETGYSNFHDGILVIDDFGQGEPTMFFNNGLYRYAGGGEVTLIHDFSDEWMSMSTDPARTQLLFGGGDPFGDDIRIVDLKTFEVTDRAGISYDLDGDGNLIFLRGVVNGAPADEETALAACNKWRSICSIHLIGRGAVGDLDLNAAWREYDSRG